MLSNLLRTSSFGNVATSSDPNMLSPASAMVEAMTAASGSMSNGNGSGYNGEEYSHSPSTLDHLADDLKYKLFASKNIPSNSPSSASYALFRVLIAEETARMCRNNYNVVMDFSTVKGRQMDQIRPNELKEYIFGSPIRSADLSEGNKFRTIPNSGLVLITRIFFTNDNSSWKSRLAVSLCVPAVLVPIIPEAWQYIKRWLNDSQSIILDIWNRRRNGKSKNYQDGVLPNNLDFHFPHECDTIVQILQNKLIPCLISFMEIPRIFPYPQNHRTFIRAWFKDIFNWLEIKDGSRMNFLPALLGKIICDFKNSMDNDSEATRIVVISCNNVIANKLLFIISGLLEPRYKGKIKFLSQADSSEYLPQHNLCHPIPKRDLFKKGRYNSAVNNTNKGWEIPRIDSRNSIVSVSSNEQLAEVIQPSSLKSGSNSLQYLSSSLSSHNGPSSYGSWFNKIAGNPTSPSLAQKNNDQWNMKLPIDAPVSIPNQEQIDDLISYPDAGSNLEYSSSVGEYDEFPWVDTRDSLKIDSNHKNNANTNDVAHPMAKSFLSGAPLGEVKLRRNCQRIDQEDLIDKAFAKICKPGSELNEGEYEIIPGDSRHAAFMQIDMDSQNLRQTKPLELLPRYTNYLPKFNRWFKLLGVPAGNESESRVIYSMRKDLQTSASSRTLLVSLRSKEIKEIIIMRSDSNEQSNNNRHKIVQKTKKIFNNGKCGNISSRLRNCIAFVNASIQKTRMICEDHDRLREQIDQGILDVFETLLHYETC